MEEKKRKEKERNSDMIHKQENDPLGRWLLMGIYLSRDGKNNLIREGIENTSLNYWDMLESPRMPIDGAREMYIKFTIITINNKQLITTIV